VIRAAAGSTISQDFKVWIAARFHRCVAAAFAAITVSLACPEVRALAGRLAAKLSTGLSTRLARTHRPERTSNGLKPCHGAQLMRFPCPVNRRVVGSSPTRGAANSLHIG